MSTNEATVSMPRLNVRRIHVLFKRELYYNFASKLITVGYAAQIFFLMAGFWIVLSGLGPALSSIPGGEGMLIRKLASIVLISQSIFLVMQSLYRGLLDENTNGVLEVMLTLGVRAEEIILGRALALLVLGYVPGLLIFFLEIGYLKWQGVSVGAGFANPALWVVYFGLLAPVFLLGFFADILSIMYRLKERRVVMTLIQFALFALFFSVGFRRVDFPMISFAAGLAVCAAALWVVFVFLVRTSLKKEQII